jgi:undecaprenyl-diphosphatase
VGWQSLNCGEAALIADTPALPARPPHAVVTAVTTAGRGGALWLVLCGLEAVRPRGDRRAARRAAVAIGAALVTSQVLKRVVPKRPRPEKRGGPARRSLPESPDSSSFPSAHAATAAAFTAVVLAHDRRLAALVAPLTVTATYGRLRTRVHWPTDLVAGVAIGVASAVGTCLTARRRAG